LVRIKAFLDAAQRGVVCRQRVGSPPLIAVTRLVGRTASPGRGVPDGVPIHYERADLLEGIADGTREQGVKPCPLLIAEMVGATDE